MKILPKKVVKQRLNNSIVFRIFVKMARLRAIFVLGNNFVTELVMSEAVQLVVGLGNPGSEYAGTRHNVGFWFVDQLAREFGQNFRKETKFHGDVAKINVEGKALWLLKPQTFMNRSGQSVSALMKYYKLTPGGILVVHDELDHDAGSVKLKFGGGHAGHNGLRDIIKAVDSKDFYRLRLGIGHPGNKNQVVNYVLGIPSREDQEKIEMTIDDAIKEVPSMVNAEFDKVMNRLN